VQKLITAIVGLGLCSMAHAADRPVRQAQDRPNIIVIFNDDMGHTDIGCYGAEKIKTPRIDQMAKEGRRFTDFYVASSVCSASRAALLTGCYPRKVGVPGVFFPNHKHPTGLDPNHYTIADMLKTVGYKTLIAGKWHLVDDPKFLPTNNGFDTFYGIPYSNDMYPARNMKYAADCRYLEGYSPEKLKELFAKTPEGKQPLKKGGKVPLMRDEECIEFPLDQTTITRRLADESIRFIKESVEEDKPFFIFLTNPMPHIPLYVSPQFKGTSEGGLYGDVIEEIDFNTGRVLDALKDNGVDENTLVIFSSDNGPWLLHGAEGGSAKPFRDGKGSSYEGGQRVPCIMRWPAKIPSGPECTELATAMDFMPTFAAITGAELPSELKVDGYDIRPLMVGGAQEKTPYDIFYFSNASAARSGNWKYRKGPRYGRWSTPRGTPKPKVNPVEKQLFNLSDDPGESKNLIGKYPELEQRLTSKIDEHICESYFPNGGDDILPGGDFEDLGAGTLPARWKASAAPAGSNAKVVTFKEGDNTCLSISLSDHKKDWTAFTSPDVMGLVDAKYTLSFRAKAIAAPVGVKFLMINPWSWIKAKQFELTTEWQTYSYSAVADTLGERRKKIFFRMDMLNNGTVLIDDIKLSFER